MPRDLFRIRYAIRASIRGETESDSGICKFCEFWPEKLSESFLIEFYQLARPTMRAFVDRRALALKGNVRSANAAPHVPTATLGNWFGGFLKKNKALGGFFEHATDA